MNNLTHFKNSFATGEVSPFIHQSGSDLKIYQGSLVHCHNYLPLRTRALIRRSGTRKYHTFDKYEYCMRLLSFIVSSRETYLLVLSDKKLQIFSRIDGLFEQVKSLSIPYKDGEIGDINVAQHTDTMWLAHPNYPPYQLTLRDGAWEFKQVSFKHVPQLEQQFVRGKKVDATLHVPFANTEDGKEGVVETRANGDVFKRLDVGRQLSLGWHPPVWKADTWYLENSYVTHGEILLKCVQRGKSQKDSWKISATEKQQTDGSCVWEKVADDKKRVHLIWATGVIIEFNTSRRVLVDIGKKLPIQDDVATSHWSFGEWGRIEGYPSLVSFYEDRLVFTGNRGFSQTIHFSKHEDFTDFSPWAEKGEATDKRSSFSIRLSSGTKQDIQWIQSMESGLFIGTDSSVWLASTRNDLAAISKEEVNVRCLSGFGGVSIPPVLVGSHCVFVQDSGRALISVVKAQRDNYSFKDLNVYAEHMLLSGVKEVILQHSPYSILWVLRLDGSLVSCTFDTENEVLAWHSHSLGGGAKVCSVASFMSFRGGQDEVWFLVERNKSVSLEKLGDFQRRNMYRKTDIIDGLAK